MHGALRFSDRTFRGAARGRRTTCDPTWRPAIVYIATILAVGACGSGVTRRVMGAQWMEVVNCVDGGECERTQRMRLGSVAHAVAGGCWL